MSELAVYPTSFTLPTLDEINGWAEDLEQLHLRLAHHFARSEVRQSVLAYLKGLTSTAERKNSWQLASACGQKRPDSFQRLLNSAQWQADGVRDDLQAYVAEHLGDAGAVLVVDETGFLKKGTKSAGVKRQYSGTAGRVENCQIGVFVSYASPKGHTLIDRELYLPREWVADQARREQAAIPLEVAFATKPQLAIKMFERALRAKIPFSWVSGDEIYGGDRNLRLWLEEHQLAFALAVAKNEPLWYDRGRGPEQVEASVIASKIKPTGWHRLSCGVGAKGPRLYDWGLVKLARWRGGEWGHWLLVRSSLATPTELAYYVISAPAATELQKMVEVVGQRWRVEECFESAKNEVGLSHYEVRLWHSWYRHITLAMFAHAYLSVIRYRAWEKETQKKESLAQNKRWLLEQPSSLRKN